MRRIPAGDAVLGGSDPSDGFGWDNEYAAHTVHVPEFSIGKYKVSNGEYLEFVKAGGRAPFYWAKREGGWFWRGMFEEVPLPLGWPVYVTLDQARAYASYCEAAVPTEAQYHRALALAGGNGIGANGTGAKSGLSLLGSGADCEVQGHLADGGQWVGVDEFRCSLRLRVLLPRPTYPGYSANFFDGKHYVLKGASPRTAAKLARPSLRNWFRAEYPYVYATFRLCLP